MEKIVIAFRYFLRGKNVWFLQSCRKLSIPWTCKMHCFANVFFDTKFCNVRRMHQNMKRHSGDTDLNLTENCAKTKLSKASMHLLLSFYFVIAFLAVQLHKGTGFTRWGFKWIHVQTIRHCAVVSVAPMRRYSGTAPLASAIVSGIHGEIFWHVVNHLSNWTWKLKITWALARDHIQCYPNQRVADPSNAQDLEPFYLEARMLPVEERSQTNCGSCAHFQSLKVEDKDVGLLQPLAIDVEPLCQSCITAWIAWEGLPFHLNHWIN